MKINELISEPLSDFRKTAPTKRFEVKEFMDKYGFTQIGTGSFGMVFEHPNLDYVLKLFKVRDDGFLTWVRYSIKRPSPYVPKFIGKPMRINDTYAVIRTERLTPSEGHVSADMVYTISNYADNVIEDKVVPAEEREIEERFPGLTDILKDVGKLATQLGKPGADMNISNMMMRGHQLVIIDPIVGEWFN